MANKKTTELIEKLNKRKNDVMRYLDVRFSQSPKVMKAREFFDWAEGTMRLKAEMEVLNVILEALTEKNAKADFGSIRRWLIDQVLSRGANMERSTSPTLNLYERSLLYIYSDMLRTELFE